MPSHLKAWFYILLLALPVAYFLSPAKNVAGANASAWKLRLAAWFSISTAAFVSGNFWIFLLVAAGALAFFRRREHNAIAAYLLLLLAAPAIEVPMPGFGAINMLFVATWPRALSLFLLVPVAFALRTRSPSSGISTLDCFVGLYAAVLLVQQFNAYGSATGIGRDFVNLSLDLLVPYYVASRSVKTAADMQDALIAFVYGAALLAPIAIFEFLRGWLLYSELPSALGVYWDGGSYLQRGESIRALASAGHSLVLGYVLAIALVILVALRSHFVPRTWMSVVGLLALALIATLSKGPWVGAFIGVIAVNALGKGGLKRLMTLTAFGGVASTTVLLTPYADRFIEYLPFVGKLDEGSALYRERLLEVSLSVIQQNLLFGTPFYLENAAMEVMRQGQGIIDIVNVYVAVTLATGLVGLTLFGGMFLIPLVSLVLRLVNADSQRIPDDTARAVAGSLLAIMAMITAVSNILSIPLIYTVMLGLAQAQLRLQRSSEVDEYFLERADIEYRGAPRMSGVGRNG